MVEMARISDREIHDPVKDIGNKLETCSLNDEVCKLFIEDTLRHRIGARLLPQGFFFKAGITAAAFQVLWQARLRGSSPTSQTMRCEDTIYESAPITVYSVHKERSKAAKLFNDRGGRVGSAVATRVPRSTPN